jgi:Cytochrome P460
MMKRLRRWIGSAVLVSAAAWAGSDDQPRYTDKGALLFPANYREWIYLSSGLGMNYSPGPGDEPRFDNVFVTPSAYRSFLKNGTWPDKAVFVIEVRAASSKGSINQAGHFQSDLVAIEAEVKDEGRFPGKWAFFSLAKGTPAGKLLPPSANCYTCHAQHGAVDNTFVQFYPTLLEVAKSKGTLK